jgi:Predicted transcriptional regulators
MNDERYRVGELAEKAGVTRRTIHYYTGRGILPPPDGTGLGTTYSDEHLYRVILIKKMQDAFLPLDEIKKIITGMTLDEVKRNINKDNMQGVVMEQSAEYMASRKSGISYERITVGYGVEIHFPQGNEKAAELADKLYKIAEKIIKEG